MKLHCKNCGCHFPDEFEETLEQECTFWKARGFPDDFPEKYYRKIWDAMCSIPYDEIADETGICLTSLDLTARENVVYSGNEFEELVPGYKDWPDQKRKRFQKAWFKRYYQPKTGQLLWETAMVCFAESWNNSA